MTKEQNNFRNMPRYEYVRQSKQTTYSIVARLSRSFKRTLGGKLMRWMYVCTCVIMSCRANPFRVFRSIMSAKMGREMEVEREGGERVRELRSYSGKSATESTYTVSPHFDKLLRSSH